jgi:uncharacterized repeat protein (TIGR01451 family)
MRLSKLLFLVLSLLITPTVFAVGTGANTTITNTANITFDTGVTIGATASGSVNFQVDEIIAATQTWQDGANVAVLSPDTDQVLSFLLTNVGNGVETFSLNVINALVGDNFDPTNPRIYLDNGNGTYDGIATETLYVPGVNDPVLDANGVNAMVIFVLNDIPGALATGNTGISRLVASSATPGASGSAVGDILLGQGDGGTDAVVGTTTADVNADGTYIIQGLAVNLVKSSDVVNDGSGCTTGCAPLPGATIRYSIAVNVAGSGTAEALVITDVIPANTTYLPNTITLDAAVLTDLVDADAANFAANTVTVNLGNVLSPVTRTITFDVTIN